MPESAMRRSLALAISLSRAVVTFDRADYRRLHRIMRPHFGIIMCTDNPDRLALAGRIHAAISAAGSLVNKLLSIFKGP